MNKSILRLAIPNIISNLAIPLLGAIDTALVGHLDAVYYIGAVAIGGMIFNFVYWGFGFLRMGTTGLTAQSFGKKSNKEMIHILLRALIVAIGGAAILLILQKPIAILSFWLVNASPEVEKYAAGYFYIRIYAAPATLALYAFHGWFLGMQNARYPLILTVISNVTNIIFNVLFVRVYNMTSDGIALGTVFAQYIGLIFAVILFMRKYHTYLDFIIRTDIFEINAIKRFFNINRDIFIRTLCLIFAFSFFTAKSAEFGDEILAVNTILLQLWMVFSYGIDGFAFAAESIIGKYIGSGNKNKLQLAVKYIFVWGVGLGFVFMIVYAVGGKFILGLFTNKSFIVTLAIAYLGWTIAAPVVNSFCYIWDGIFIGATAGKEMRNTMIFSTFFVFLPAFYIGKYLAGNHGIWAAMLLFMLARWLSMQVISKRVLNYK